MMGAGKSSVGRLLAQRRGVSFIDLDDRVERLFGASVAALFEHGEAYFRACERAGLRSLLAEPGFAGSGAVVATGGGFVVDPANLDDVAGVATTVYLELAPEVLAVRLTTPEQRDARPLLAGDGPDALEARLTGLLHARERAYRRATRCVDANATPDEVADRVEAALAAG